MQYPVQTPAIGNYDTAAPDISPDSLTALEALADQLHAATSDAVGAWVMLKHGKGSIAGEIEQATQRPVTNDRFVNLRDSIYAEVARLRVLAEEIRARA